MTKSRPRLSRRSVLIGGSAFLASSAFANETLSSPETGTKLVLLGTMGAPFFLPDRKMSGQAIVVDGHVYLVDVGYGIVGRMAEARLGFSDVAGVFLTHLHSDHMSDYPMLALQITRSPGMMPVSVFGPEGIQETHVSALGTFGQVYDKRPPTPDALPFRERFTVTMLSKDGVIFEDEHVKVTAAAVPHPPMPSFAYRFDSRDRSIVISGDTRESDALVDLAKGADILVHEAIYLPGFAAPPYNMPEEMLKMATTVHTTPEQAGKVAQRAGVKALVLSHLIPGESSTTDEVWRSEAAKHFTGKVIVGHDLMAI